MPKIDELISSLKKLKHKTKEMNDAITAFEERKHHISDDDDDKIANILLQLFTSSPVDEDPGNKDLAIFCKNRLAKAQSLDEPNPSPKKRSRQ